MVKLSLYYNIDRLLYNLSVRRVSGLLQISIEKFKSDFFHEIDNSNHIPADDLKYV